MNAGIRDNNVTPEKILLCKDPVRLPCAFPPCLAPGLNAVLKKGWDLVRDNVRDKVRDNIMLKIPIPLWLTRIFHEFMKLQVPENGGEAV
jgi:hypothetical protein